MLVACRLAGLSALGAHYAGVKCRAIRGRRSRFSWRRQDPPASAVCSARWDGMDRSVPDRNRAGARDGNVMTDAEIARFAASVSKMMARLPIVQTATASTGGSSFSPLATMSSILSGNGR